MAASTKKLNLKILFDTNIIYNHSSSEVLSKEMAELIEKHSKPSDIEISWHIPETVLNERRFQMRKRALELFPSLEKLEKLLGHNLAITPEIIESRIEDAINRNISAYNLKVQKILPEKVNWENLIHSACFRLPPFEDNKTEKGFRDALILEALIQIIAESPVSVSSCRIILLTNDKLLSVATKLKTSDKKNVSIIQSVEELDSLINILDSNIKEELINSISEQVSNMFFIPQNSETIYYKEDLREKIKNLFSKELNLLPANADTRETVQWLISNPGFEKKEKQRFFWKTLISIESKAYVNKTTIQQSGDSSLNYYDQINNLNNSRDNLLYGTIMNKTEQAVGNLLSNYGTLTNNNSYLPLTGSKYSEISNLYPVYSKELISTGTSKIEVIWSVTLTTTNILKNPKIEKINFIETTWE